MYNTALNTLDLGFTALEKIEKIDYVALSNKVTTNAATISAIVVGVCSYIWLALQLFWEDHGDQILTLSFQTIIHIADFSHDCYTSGVALRRALGTLFVRALDNAYYAAIAA
jgi:hypothetical protein